jgi:hypothetical protein
MGSEKPLTLSHPATLATLATSDPLHPLSHPPLLSPSTLATLATLVTLATLATFSLCRTRL